MSIRPTGKPLDLGDFTLGPPITAAPKKTGMFGAGKGQAVEAISAALLAMLASRGNNPGAVMGLQMLNQRRNSRDEQAQYGQRREDEFQDWMRKQAYQAANPNPVNNDTVADYNFWQSKLTPEQFQEYVANKVNPPQFMNMPGVGIVQIPRSGGGQMGAPAPQGVTFTPLDEGGPTPQASGGFPRPF